MRAISVSANPKGKQQLLEGKTHGTEIKRQVTCMSLRPRGFRTMWKRHDICA